MDDLKPYQSMCDIPDRICSESSSVSENSVANNNTEGHSPARIQHEDSNFNNYGGAEQITVKPDVEFYTEHYDTRELDDGRESEWSLEQQHVVAANEGCNSSISDLNSIIQQSSSVASAPCVKQSTKLNVVKCRYCWVSISNLPLMFDHLLTHLEVAHRPVKAEVEMGYMTRYFVDGQSPDMICLMCGRVMVDRLLARVHVKVHVVDDCIFFCNLCEKVFLQEADYIDHLGDMHGIRNEIKCGNCLAVCANLRMLTLHSLECQVDKKRTRRPPPRLLCIKSGKSEADHAISLINLETRKRKTREPAVVEGEDDTAPFINFETRINKTRGSEVEGIEDDASLINVETKIRKTDHHQEIDYTTRYSERARVIPQSEKQVDISSELLENQQNFNDVNIKTSVANKPTNSLPVNELPANQQPPRTDQSLTKGEGSVSTQPVNFGPVIKHPGQNVRYWLFQSQQQAKVPQNGGQRQFGQAFATVPQIRLYKIFKLQPSSSSRVAPDQTYPQQGQHQQQEGLRGQREMSQSPQSQVAMIGNTTISYFPQQLTKGIENVQTVQMNSNGTGTLRSPMPHFVMAPSPTLSQQSTRQTGYLANQVSSPFGILPSFSGAGHGQTLPGIYSDCQPLFNQNISTMPEQPCNTFSNCSSVSEVHKFGPDGKVRFVCKECGKHYLRQNNLDIHMNLHTGQNLHSCSKCFAVFTRSSHLKVHERAHVAKSNENP